MLILFLSCVTFTITYFQNPVHFHSHQSIFTFLQTVCDAILSVSTDLTFNKTSRLLKYSKRILFRTFVWISVLIFPNFWFSDYALCKLKRSSAAENSATINSLVEERPYEKTNEFAFVILRFWKQTKIFSSADLWYPKLILFAVCTLQTNIKSRTQWRKPLNRFGESKEKIFHSFSNKHRIVNIMSPNLSAWMKEIKLFLWWIIPKIKCFEKCQNYKSRKGPPFYQLETLHNKDTWKII